MIRSKKKIPQNSILSTLSCVLSKSRVSKIEEIDPWIVLSGLSSSSSSRRRERKINITLEFLFLFFCRSRNRLLFIERIRAQVEVSELLHVAHSYGKILQDVVLQIKPAQAGKLTQSWGDAN